MYLLCRYNTATTISFPIVKRGVVDLATTADWAPATGDTKISKDAGAIANTTNNPVIVSGSGAVSWSLALTAPELTCAVADIQIVDSATKAVEDQWLKVYTYGNASAKIILDYADPVRAGLTALPNAAAASLGGLLVLGSGAGAINQDANGRIDVNAVAFNGSTANLDKFTAILDSGIVGTVSTANTAGSATSFRCADITEATATHYLGKQCWVRTGTLAAQWWGVVTAYALISGEGAFTLSPGSPTSEVLANGITVYFV